MDYMALDAQYMMPAFQGIRLKALDRAQGCRIWDTDGREYLDFLAGIATVALGHGHPAVIAALGEQAEKLWHVSNYFVSAPAALLAQKLTAAVGMDRVFFANSGAEANEGAVKLARRYFSSRGIARWKIITALDSFHGRTLAMVAATGQPKYQAPYHPVPAGFVHVPFDDVAALEAAIDDDTAAIMLEPIQGEAGVVVPSGDYLAAARALCDRHGILLIADEVQTGMGRTGALTACQGIGVKPDILTLAKALGNGFPIAAFLASGDAATAFSPGDHGTTIGGNALGCAVALAVLETFDREEILRRCRETGAYFIGKLAVLAEAHPRHCFAPRGRGLMLALPMAAHVDTKAIVKEMLAKGFIINAAGNNTLRFVPPLIIGTSDIDAMTGTLAEAVARL